MQPPARLLAPPPAPPANELSRTQKHNRRRRHARALKRAGRGPTQAESTEDPLLVPSVRRPSRGGGGGAMPRSPHSGAAAAVAQAADGGGGGLGGHCRPALTGPPLAKRWRGNDGPAPGATDSAISCGTGQEAAAAVAAAAGLGSPALPAGAAAATGSTLTATDAPPQPPPRGPCRRDMSAIITAALRRDGQAAAAVVAEAEEEGGPAAAAAAQPHPSAAATAAAPARPSHARARPALDGNYSRYYGYRLGLGGGAAAAAAPSAPLPPPTSPAARVAALGGPATADPRLAALDLRSLVRGRAVLDVGCNAGLVSLALAVRGRPACVTGVDIDASLIRAARRCLAAERSAAAALAADSGAPGRARSAGEAAGRALRRISFRREDITAEGAPDAPPPAHPPGGYGAIFCLSVTKWVHLRGGDGGLQAFLARLAGLLSPGGHLVLEPQPWSSYERAARKKLAGPRAGGPRLAELRLRPDAFPEHLGRAHGLALVARRVPGGGVAPGFARELLVFKKRGGGGGGSAAAAAEKA